MKLESLEKVLEVWSSVDRLVEDMKAILGQDIPAAAGAGTLEEALVQADQDRLDALDVESATDVETQADTMQDWLLGQLPAKANGWTIMRQGDVEKWLGVLKAWAKESEDGSLEKAMGKTAWNRLTPEGLQKCTRCGRTQYCIPKRVFEFADLQIALEKLPTISAALRNTPPPMLQNACSC